MINKSAWLMPEEASKECAWVNVGINAGNIKALYGSAELIDVKNEPYFVDEHGLIHESIGITDDRCVLNVKNA